MDILLQLQQQQNNDMGTLMLLCLHVNHAALRFGSLMGEFAVAATLGPSHQGVGEQALVAAVLGTGAAQEQLVPALMKAYAAADYVVGLDVDKDQFDKFGMRNCIDLILLELWKDPGQLLAPCFP